MKRATARFLTVVVVLGGSLTLFPRGSAATVEEQRARLPPPAECPDKVEGTWAALYHTVTGSWIEYTATVRRRGPAADGNAAGPIEVEMRAHAWDGPKSNDKPLPCTPGQREITVTMPGTGAIDAATNLFFGAKTYQVESLACGNDTVYHPDNFKGRIDPALQEFQSENNDGASAVHEPVVFRRVRCLGAAARGKAVATPPAFAPPKRSVWGCGR
jgi:hypothetical protein